MDHTPQPSVNADVAVIGAGIAGLTAAYTAQKAGCRVMVLEREMFPGGRMSSEEFEGCIADRGAYTLSGYASRTLALAQELGCGELIALLSPCAGYAHERSIRHYRSDSLIGMGLGVGLRPHDMFTSLKLLRASVRLAPHLRLHKPDETTFAWEQETAAAYVLRVAGPRVLERVAYPLISALYISDPEHTSAAALLATIGYVRGIKLFNSPQGIGFLCRRLAELVPVRFGIQIDSLRTTENGVELRSTSGDAFRANAVICAVPAPDALQLLPDCPATLAAGLRDIAYTSCVVTAFVVRGRLQERAFSVALPRDRFPTLAVLTCEHNKHPERVSPGHDVLTAYSSAHGSQVLLDLDDASLQEAVLREVEGIYPGLSHRVESVRIYRWPLACAQLRPGDLRRRQALQAALPTTGPIYFAGDYLISSSSIEGSLISGQVAGSRAASRLASLRLPEGPASMNAD